MAPQEILEDIRAALRLAGISEKAAAIDLNVTQGVLSRRLSGEKTMAVTAMSDWPPSFWQWFAVRVAMRVGAPEELSVWARLHRSVRRHRRSLGET